MIPLAERWEAGVDGVLRDAAVPWHVTRLGARAEYHFMPDPPRTGAAQWANTDPELERFLHLWAMNRHVLMTPFHNMALMSPATTEADVDRHTAVFAAGDRGALRVTEAPRIRLRDVTLADADLLDAWSADPVLGGEFNDFGLEPRPIDREALRRGPLRNERNGQLIVERIADLRAARDRRLAQGRLRAGHGIRGLEHRDRARCPTHAARATAPRRRRSSRSFLFAQTPMNRIEAQTDVENIAEQRSLEKAGFRREGVARGSQFRAGGYHDLVVYSRLRDDP